MGWKERLKQNTKLMTRQGVEEKLRTAEGLAKARGFKIEDKAKLRTYIRRKEISELITTIAVVGLLISFFSLGVAFGQGIAILEDLEEKTTDNDLEVDEELPGIVVYNNAGEPMCKAPNGWEQAMIAKGYEFARC